MQSLISRGKSNNLLVKNKESETPQDTKGTLYKHDGDSEVFIRTVI